MNRRIPISRVRHHVRDKRVRQTHAAVPTREGYREEPILALVPLRSAASLQYDLIQQLE